MTVIFMRFDIKLFHPCFVQCQIGRQVTTMMMNSSSENPTDMVCNLLLQRQQMMKHVSDQVTLCNHFA